MERTFEEVVPEVEQPHWAIRTFRRVERWARPWLGWGVLLGCMALAMLPAVALRANHWIDLGSLQPPLEWSGPLAVMAVWLVWGWRQPVRRAAWLRWLLLLPIGPLVVGELLLGWIPGPAAWVRAALDGSWAQIGPNMLAAWVQAAVRVQLWWDGVVAGGAAQDNLVFALAGSVVVWTVGCLTGWLARRTRQGYAAAAPALWLLALILLYSSTGRFLLVLALGLTIGLHVLLDHRRLVERWQAQQLDFDPGLLLDRLLAVVSAALVVLTLAITMPSLYVQGLVDAYYGFLGPANARFETFWERLFPDVASTSRLRGGGRGEGLPNEFLLRGGPDLGNAVIMRIRTDESAAYQLPFDETAAPPGHYMRGATFAVYDGRGWSSTVATQSREYLENQPWQTEELWGRKVVVQTVILEAATALLFAAPEPIEASVPVRLEERSPGDQVRINSRQRSYAVVSAVPAVDEAMLRGLPAWGEELPLPAAADLHLQLPPTVTDRTRALATELTADRPTAYDKALAIETYLRGYVYDLEVTAPPADVGDVADYFLFDLRRGYCDYYATAFVVLARLAGLPTRFATGYAVGAWNPVEAVWVVTEAEAHSWPEVYFPQVGWVPFEPTAGRPALERIAEPTFAGGGGSSAPAAAPEPPREAADRWNWQMLVWAVPVVLLGWGGWWGLRQWQRRREDPWLALLKWGQGAGRPLQTGETVLEYGRELASHVVAKSAGGQDASRRAAHEIEAVSVAVNASHYAPVGERAAAQRSIAARWARLRSYLPLVKLS